jgi:hypothetical protein
LSRQRIFFLVFIFLGLFVCVFNPNLMHLPKKCQDKMTRRRHAL